MKKAKKALALFLCTIMLFSSLYVGGGLGFWNVALEAWAAEASTNALETVQSPSSVRLGLNFNKNWKFHLNDAQGAWSKDYNDKSWRTVDLPHDFSIESDFTSENTEVESGNLPGGAGWYRKTFTMPVNYKDKSVVLLFDGSYNYTEIFVNSELVATNKYGYNSFAVDISNKLVYDGKTKNVVSVKVESQMPSSRWYSGAGLYRDVTMVITDDLHISLDGIQVTMPELKNSRGTNGKLSTKVNIYNSDDTQRDYKVKTTLFDAQGKAVSTALSASKTLASKNGDNVTVFNEFSNPKLWNTENPYLYTLRTEIISADEFTVIDSYDTQIGYRWTNWDVNSGFSLNGHNTKIKGVCLHHDQGALGAVQEYDAIYRQVKILKDMGVNAVRTSHNVTSKVLIDVCNELGVMVMEEFFDGWNLKKNGNNNDFAKDFGAQVDTRLIGARSGMSWAEFVVKSTVKRDRNDPSIVIWSAGNELNEGVGSANVNAGYAAQIRNWIHEFDVSRELTFGNNTSGSDNNRNTITNSMDVVGGNYNQDYWNSRPYSNKPYVGTETASSVNTRGEYNAVGGGNNDVKYVNESLKTINSYDASKVSWGNTAADALFNMMSADWNSGEFVWTGFDYIGEPTPWNNDSASSWLVPNSSYFGIIDTAGFAKDSYYLYRSVWNESSDTLHLLPGTWNSNELTLKDGFVNVAVYSNADRIELLLNGEVIGEATATLNTTSAGHKYKTWTETEPTSPKCKINDPLTLNNGSVVGNDLYPQFQVKYEEGTLSVKAYKGDTEITDSAVGTKEVKTGEAAQIVASVWDNKTTLTADGNHLAYIELEAQDAEGRFFNDYNGTVQITLTGNGEIVGVDNGYQGTTEKFQNPSALTADKKSANIRLFNGKAVIIVSSTEDIGEIKVNISSASGLPIIGNTSKLFRSNVADGTITLNAVAETKAQTADEFEEVIPQFFEPEYAVEGAAPADTTRFIKRTNDNFGPNLDHIKIRYSRDMYLDINETLQDVGYKFFYDGGHYGGYGYTGNPNPDGHRVLMYYSLWGGDDPATTDRDFVNNFTGYRAEPQNHKTYDSENGPERWQGHSVYIDRNNDNNVNEFETEIFKLYGAPVSVGDFTYKADSVGNEKLVRFQQWEQGWFSGSWADRKDVLAQSDRNLVVDENNRQAPIEMTIHVYDKAPLKRIVNLDIVKQQNAGYVDEYLVGGSWNKFTNSYNSQDISEVEAILKRRNTTQSEINAAAQPFADAVNEANKLKFRAPDSAKKPMQDQLKHAEEIMSDRDYEKKYTYESRQLFEKRLNELKNSKYLTPDGITTYTVDMNDFNSINAGYKAAAEAAEMRKLADDIAAAIASLKAETTKKVNATIFKYGYDNSNGKTGNARYAKGGTYMNEIAMNSLDTKLQARRDEIGNMLDSLIGGRNQWHSEDWRTDEIDDAVYNYKRLYELAFTNSAVKGGDNVSNFYKSAWNVWCKTGTQAPNESGEQGASVQGLANSRLSTAPDGSKYFTSHAPYTSPLPYVNNTTNGNEKTQNYRIDYAIGKGMDVYLPALPNMSVESPDLFKKEALLSDGTPTQANRGNFAKYYWDTQFPLEINTVDGVNYYKYDSTSSDYILQAKYDDDKRTAEMNLVYTDANWGLNDLPSGNKGFFPFNFQEGANLNTTEDPIYHYGLTFDTDFYIPQSGQYTEGQDIVFDFTGDDDVYVYIDDVLVLDNGGLHGARKSSINFTDMSVRYQYVQDVTESKIKTGPRPVEGSDDIVYKYGETNEGISPDNIAALNKLHDVRTDGDSHTLTFFFLERGSGSSNCDISYNVKETSRDVKLASQTYSVDYGANLKADIKENDFISEYAKTSKTKIEYLGITEPNQPLGHDTIVFAQTNNPMAPVLYRAFGSNDEITFNSKSGQYTLNKNGKLNYRTDNMNMTEPESFYVCSKITNDPSFAKGTVYYRYEKVTFVPATTIYYEDNKSIEYEDGTVAGGTVDPASGKWTTVGDSNAQNALVHSLSSLSEKIYGSSPLYSDFEQYSGGSAQNVTVSQKNNPNPKYSGGENAKWPVAKFQFTGTGFDIISVTNNTTGAFKVDVVSANTGKKYSKMVDTYYGFSYGELFLTEDGNVTLENTGNHVYRSALRDMYTGEPTHYDENGKIVEGIGENPAYAYGWVQDSAKTNSLYQIPVIKFKDLEYDTYNVTITPMYATAFAHSGDSYDFVLDAIRVYDPAGSSITNDVINDQYDKDKENHPIYIELRDKLVGAEDLAVNANDGAVVVSGKTLDGMALERYLKGCPNHEVYLNNQSAVSFEIWSEKVPESVQIAAKLIKGQPAINVAYGINTGSKNINTSTDLYYDIEAILSQGVSIKWTEVQGENGKTFYKTEPITIENTGAPGTVLSLTNLKLTFIGPDADYVDPEVKIMANEQTAVVADQAVRMIVSDLDVRNAKASVERDKNGDNVVTMYATTSLDVDKLNVRNNNGLVATEAKYVVNGNEKQWTVTSVENASGRHTYSLEGVFENGYTGDSDPLEVTFTVKKLNIFQKIDKAVRDFWGRIFGKR